MHALITRPLEDAKPLADLLSARGVDCIVEPLLEIVPHDDARIDLDGVQALLFTSANGVRAFAAHSSRRDIGVLTVGEGSAEAARAAGFRNVMVAGGDVDALVKLTTDSLDPKAGPVFHGAGSVLAGDLQGKLEQAGFTLRRTVLYETRTASAFSPEARMNLALGGIDMVLLFSPRTARTFATIWQSADRPSLAKTAALCLSAAVAREIADLGWQRIETAAQPDQPSMLTLVEAEIARRTPPVNETKEAPVRDTIVRETPMTKTVPTAPAPKASGRGIGSLIIGLIAGAVAGAAVVVAAPYWQPLIRTSLSANTQTSADATPDLSSIEARLKALEQTPVTLGGGPTSDQVNAAVSGVVGKLDQKIAPLADRIGKLEQESGAPPDLLPLLNRIAKLEQQQGAMAQTPSAPDLSGDVAATKAANDALAQQLKAAQDQIATLESKQTALDGAVSKIVSQPAAVTAEQQRNMALVLALSELRGALAVDQPYAARLRVIDTLAGDDAGLKAKLGGTLDPLRPLSERGTPTLAQLQATLPATEIAEAANSETAAHAVGANAGWSERLINRLSEAVTIRPVGANAEGDGPLPRLARAEARLKAGDLAATVAELDGLQGKPGAAAKSWLDGAKARLVQEQASAALDQAATALLAPKPEQ